MSISTTPVGFLGPMAVGALMGTDERTMATLAEVAPAVVRPVGLAVALSQTASAFIRNAKLGKHPSQRAFNALHYS